jgi:hypothetical protein
MLGSRQFSLIYLFVLVTGVALAAGFIRLVWFKGEAVLWWIDLLLVIFFGSLLGSIGVWMAFHAVRVALYWPKASARIVRYSIRRYETQPFYHAVVQFETANGQAVTTISNTGSWRRRWPTGSVISVKYHPENPRWIEIVSRSNLWGFGAPLYVLGFLLFMAFIMYGLPRVR